MKYAVMVRTSDGEGSTEAGYKNLVIEWELSLVPFIQRRG